VLDLGCGTGLGGAAFRSFSDWLVGIDLSPAMIDRAAAKGLYDRLITADVTAALVGEATNAAKYHLVIAADMFVYMNELAPIFTHVARVLAPDGMFAFTVETYMGDGVKLLPTLRYAHGESYLRAILDETALSVEYFARTPVRQERSAPVDSLVIVSTTGE
jgi:predicted TPR repeat methyltransferase